MSEILDINNLIVVKHNRVIDAQYTMSTFEQRILLTCISKIDSTKELENNHVFIVTVDDILDLVDVPRASAYPNLKRACDALFENVVHIATPEDPDTKILKTRWVYGIGYVENKGMIKLRFTPEIMPFLTKLSRNFTKYKLAHVLKFKSNYSFRLYEWLCYWGGIEHVASVEWLRENLQLLDKYERMVDFKNNVIDVAVGEINATSNIKVTYEQIKKGRNIIAFRFIYTIKHDKTTTKAEPQPLDLSKLESNQPEKPETTGGINIDIFKFNDKDKQLAKNALAKVPEATQRIILDMFKSALAKGEVKYPLRYLNSLVSKFLSGDLDTTAFDNVPAPSNKTRRADKIKQTFAKNTDEIKAELASEGFVFIKGEGSISKSEFEALGLIEKAPRKEGKSISLAELMAQAEEKEKLRQEQALAQKQAQREKEVKQPKTVAEIPVAPMSEKEIAARQKILELEAQLIAAGEFVGINEKAISKEELAELEAMQVNLMNKK